uniref:WD_REPEATS_REGION domain-containing protein n=1 Tax=Macrostomum lignano TaxID=282301 RepID=A0A1I8GTV0_9PLAT
LSARPFPTEFLSHLELAWSDTLEVAGDVSLRVPPMQADFCKRPDRPSLLAVGDEEGGVLLMDTELPAGSGLLTAWRAHRNAIFDVQWMADSADQLLTASGDKTVRLHSCLDRREIRAFNGHTSSVKSLSCRPGEPASGGQFCSSSRDGTVRLWDSRTPGGSVGVIPDAHAGGPVIAAAAAPRLDVRLHHPPLPGVGEVMRPGGGGGASSVTCAVFIDSNSLATCGAADGVIKLWDIRALSASGSGALTPRRRRSSVSAPKPLTPRQILAYPGPGKPHGYSHLAFDRGRLFASCLDSAVYEFRPLMLRPEPS